MPPVPDPQTLLDWLTVAYPQSTRSTLRRMLEAGRVTVNGKRAANAKVPIKETDVVQVADRPSRRGNAPDQGLQPLTLVFEDADLLVVDKPAGLLTSTNPREKRPTAIAIVQRYLGDRTKAGLIHRLDRDASGLLVFAKNQPAFESLKSQFFHHTVRRVYDAVVHGVVKQGGTIDSLLVENLEGKVFVTKDPRKGQRAVTHYEVVEATANTTRLQVRLETGRKHQIRAHLASRGHPIVGDVVYGPQPPKSEQLQLRAIELDLDHPRTGKRVEFRVAGLEEHAPQRTQRKEKKDGE
jgi:RluA family pseudouridine synthase